MAAADGIPTVIIKDEISKKVMDNKQPDLIRISDEGFYFYFRRDCESKLLCNPPIYN